MIMEKVQEKELKKTVMIDSYDWYKKVIATNGEDLD